MKDARSAMMRGFDAPVVRIPPPSAAPTVPGRTIWCGIDPGKTGYVVVLLPDDTLRSWAIPVDEENVYNESAIRDIVMELVALNVRNVMLERQQPAYPRPGQRLKANILVKASFHIGYGYALWVMALAMVGIKPRVVMPGQWKRAMGIAVKKGEGVPLNKRRTTGKARARALAVARFPRHNFVREGARKPQADECEAALLADYGRTKHG